MMLQPILYVGSSAHDAAEAMWKRRAARASPGTIDALLQGLTNSGNVRPWSPKPFEERLVSSL